MHKPKHRLKQAARTTLLPALAAALITLTATSCGESTKTPTTAADTTTPTTSTQTHTPPAPTHAGPATTNTSNTPKKPAPTTHSALSLLASAKHAPKLTPAKRATRAIADITLTSPTINTNNTLPTENTCQGTDRSPALHWHNIPPATKELALFAISTTPVNNKLFFDWALAHINPHLNQIQAGTLPAGAIQGRNSNGQTNYTICPPADKHETYVFLLYALPQTLNPQPGFNPQTLHQQTLQTARHTGVLVTTYQHP